MKLLALIRISLAASGCAFVLAACALTENPTTSPEATQLADLVARTQTAIAVIDLATAVVELPTSLPSNTPSQPPEAAVTFTPTLEPTATATATLVPQPENCSNKARFVEETIPDKTSFAPNKDFVKTWTLKNTGTCTWTPDYALVFVDGERMGGTDPTPLGQSVLPDGAAIISLDLVAPQAPGVSKGNWKLKSPSGKVFGLGENADKPFWVEINVVETTSELNLGEPTWVDGFDSDSGYWPLGDDPLIGYNISASTLKMTGFQITGDQWRMNAHAEINNLYLEATFRTSNKCSGKDSYGIIVRSTDSGDDIFDSGYIFTFSCDGMYRLYRLDNGTYINLLNWTANSEIKAGQNVTNKMGIYVEGELIKLYANGNRLAQVSDSGHDKGKWGLIIRTKETSGLEIFVEDVSYWILGN